MCTHSRNKKNVDGVPHLSDWLFHQSLSSHSSLSSGPRWRLCRLYKGHSVRCSRVRTTRVSLALVLHAALSCCVPLLAAAVALGSRLCSRGGAYSLSSLPFACSAAASRLSLVSHLSSRSSLVSSLCFGWPLRTALFAAVLLSSRLSSPLLSPRPLPLASA